MRNLGELGEDVGGCRRVRNQQEQGLFPRKWRAQELGPETGVLHPLSSLSCQFSEGCPGVPASPL